MMDEGEAAPTVGVPRGSSGESPFIVTRPAEGGA